MNKQNKQHSKKHFWTRALALLVCLLTIMPMAGSALPEFTDMIGDIADKLGSTKRPDADSYSEGAKYLDDFLKEHPDATVFGRGDDIFGKDEARPLSVGTPGDRIDPDWFKAVINVMGVLKTQGEFSLRPTNRDASVNNDTLSTLWSQTFDNLYINYPEEKLEGDAIGRYTERTTWPISGFMNWVTVGDYQYIEGGNYPELSTTYGEKDVDYGITSAYLGTSRVYNAGVINANGGTYLWVSVAEDGADDSVIVLPNTKPNHNVTLHFGPREYPVSYGIVVNDLYLGKKEDGTTGTVSKDLSDMTLDEIRTVWGTDVIKDTVASAAEARELVMKEVFGTLGETSETVTSNQTANFHVTIPYGTYGDVTYVAAKKPNDTVTVYPSSSGYGTQRLGTEPTYTVETDSEENESSLEVVGKPDRYSLSEPYTLGASGAARGNVAVTVTITRRWGQNTDTTKPDYNINGYQTHFSLLGDYGIAFTGTYDVYYEWLRAGYDKAQPKDDGTYDAKLMFCISASNNSSNKLTVLEINGEEINLPAGGTQDAWDDTVDGVPAITYLADGSTVEVRYVYLNNASRTDELEAWFNSEGTRNNPRERPYPDLRTINESTNHGIYIIEVKGAKQDINITNLEKNDSDSSSSIGQIIVEKADGVDVQLWYYRRYSARTNPQSQRWWATYPEGSGARIRYHRSIDQHGKFRFYYPGSTGSVVTSTNTNNSYQMYNIRVALKAGYYWPGSDRNGNYLDDAGNEIAEINSKDVATYEYTTSTSANGRTKGNRTIDPVTLYRYSSITNNGQKNHSNLGGTSEITVNGSAVNNGGTPSTLTFNSDGTYSAYLKRDDDNTGTGNYSTFTGRWSYDGTTLTFSPYNSNDRITGILTGDPMTFNYYSPPTGNNASRFWQSDFVVTKDVFDALAEGPDRWYYASLTMLPYLGDAEAKKTYLRFEAVARTYELNYLTGVGDDGLGIGPNGEYDGRLPGIEVRSTTMPYFVYDEESGKSTYIDTTKYSKATGKDENGKYYVNSFHINNKTPEDTPSDTGASYKFQYWVLTDSLGNPIDENGRVIVCEKSGEGGTATKDDIANWQAKFITFYPSDSISLSTFDGLLTTIKTDVVDRDVTEDDYTIEFDKKKQQFKFYLTACWTPDATEPFTNYITVNSRADVNNNTTFTVPWFGGDWYVVNSGDPDDKQDYETIQAGMSAGSIKAAYTYTSFLDKDAANGEENSDSVTVTINKDDLTAYMRAYAERYGKTEYLWYTFDDAQNGWDDDGEINGSNIWKKVKDKQEVPVWFLYTLGGVKINTDIDGYDQPLPYKLTLTLPTYEDEDRNPLVFEEDGSVSKWDATDYRYTAGNESQFFVANPSAEKWTYHVGIVLGTGTHDGATEEVDGRTVLKSTKYDATYTGEDGNKHYLFLTDASNGAVKVENYLGNENAFDGAVENGKGLLKLKRDLAADSTGQTYTATIYLGKGDSITIPQLPQGTTYELELINEAAHPDFEDNANRHKYDGYEMASAVPFNDAANGGTWTIWTQTSASVPTDAKVLPGTHNKSKDYFKVDMTEKDVLDKEGKKIGTLTVGFKSVAYDSTHKGINAYDTQVINVTSKGTYNLYLDQYTTTVKTDSDGNVEPDAENWINNDLLQVQNFNYLSYRTYAYNLTDKAQTLQISFSVETHRIGEQKTEDKRYLAIAEINGVPQPDWNPDDEDPTGPNQKTVSGEAEFKLSNDEKVSGEWVYDYYTHEIVWTVPNVPAGERIGLTVRTTVPAVNTETTYTGKAFLTPNPDEQDPENLQTYSDTDVKAYVFSNWLRIAAFIGSKGYVLTTFDEKQKFDYEITLSNPAPGTYTGDGPIADGNVIKYALYTDSSTYGIENADYREVTITGVTDGTFTFPVIGLTHDQRIVIYEIYDEADESTPDRSDETEINGTEEAINGVGYTVTWKPHYEDGQDKDYSVYLNAYDEGKTLGYPGKSTKDKYGEEYTYSSHIGEGIDMVVYRYMPSNSLTISKEVQGDQTTEWEFKIMLTNEDLNELESRFEVVREGIWADTDDTSDKWETETVTKDDGTKVKYITLTVTLKHDQSITIKGLPQGTEYIVSESSKTGIEFTPSYVKTDGEAVKNADGTYTLVDHGTVKGAATATGSIYVNQKYKTTVKNAAGEDEEVWANVPGDNEADYKSATNKVAFTNSMSGDLVIEKVVPGYVSTGDHKDKASFTFEITLTDAKGNAVSGIYKDATGNDVEFDANGKATVTVNVTGVTDSSDSNYGSGFGFVRITGLPNDTHYEVTETDYGTDYIPAYTGNVGTISGGDNTVVCTNNKTGTLTVQKEVVGETGRTDTGSRTDDFTFTVTLTGSGLSDTGYTAKFTAMGENAQTLEKEVTWEKKDGKLIGTFTLKHGQQVTITGLPAGTMYKVEEADTGNYTTTVTVNDNDPEKGTKTVTGSVALWSENGGTIVLYQNSRSGSTPGGILLNFLWAIPLCLLAIGGMTVIVVKRRKRAAL